MPANDLLKPVIPQWNDLTEGDTKKISGKENAQTVRRSMLTENVAPCRIKRSLLCLPEKYWNFNGALTTTSMQLDHFCIVLRRNSSHQFGIDLAAHNCYLHFDI
uniref:Uncharacterized protein n=1 Tax=Ascaris lumbricoides TaxID=6252 RepID=A0A0M3I4L0_ASCLU